MNVMHETLLACPMALTRKTIPIQFVISQIASNYLVKNSLASNWCPFMQYPG